MEKEKKLVNPVYQQIAVDIATKIVSGKYNIGEKIYGRSTLASQYNVSPETIRRAIFLLKEFNIVDSSQGVGVEIKSYENALGFIEKFKNVKTVSDLKKNIINNINEQQKLTIELQDNIKDLINYSEKFKERDFFTPFEIKITSNCTYIGKSLSEISFWQNTGATVLGIRRKDSIIVSPGPHAIFLENDIFVMVGDEETNLRVRNYLQ